MPRSPWRPWPDAIIQPGKETRRTCGCFIDPLVFGHWQPGRVSHG